MNLLDLNGTWQLSSPEWKDGKNIPVQMPGDNYTALYEAKLIPDPYYGKNELAVQEFRKQHWVFTREFDVPAELFENQQIFLDLSMVDTFAVFFLNGKKILRTENMFAAYRPEVKRFLHPGKNQLSVRMDPPEAEGEKIEKANGKSYPMCSCSKVKYLNLIRKVHCHGGWDWGITLCVCGIYRPIRLVGVNGVRLETAWTDQKFTGNNTCTVSASAKVFAYANNRKEISFSFNGETKTIRPQLKEGFNIVSVDFQVKNPKLWWPNGYGEQNLYPLEVFTAEEHKTVQIGLRTIEVVNQKDEFGISLLFQVNGVKIFAKGADWIPCDAFPSRQTPEVLDDLLESARQSNMNMLRIWGGGQYESEEFYHLCDQKGLLLWQDLMFACSIYPSDHRFIQNVFNELEYQIPRLRHHASIAIWCGDNECIGATRWHGPELRDSLLINFDRLNRELWAKTNELDPSRIFWPSSPCSGPNDFSDGWHNDSSGDMHYWEVWHGGKDFDAFYSVKPRFCSEFGYQSFPSFETVKTFCPPEQYNVFSPVMDHHQKCAKGNAPIIGMFGKYFRMPESFCSFLYLSQVQQALAIKTGVEFWRTLKPRCMGTLYWQFNDNWPIASWSSIEYGGKWKQLQYHAKRFYNPVIPVSYRDAEGKQRVFAVSDVNEKLAVEIHGRFLGFDGELKEDFHFQTNLKPLESRCLYTFSEKELAKHPANEMFLELDLTATSSSGGKYISSNTVFFEKYKLCELSKAKVGIKTVKNRNGEFQLTVSSDKPVFFLMLDAPGIRGRFSDNSVTVLPGEAKKITFRPFDKEIDPDQFKAALEFTHLRETYN